MIEHILFAADWERRGIVTETDESICKLMNSGFHYDCNYYENGEWTSRTTPELTEEVKTMICERINERFPPTWKRKIHSVFVMPISPMSGRGVMCRRVFIKGC